MPSEELKKGIPKAIVVGQVEFSDKEKAKNKADLEKIFREYGVLKTGENEK